MHPSPLFRETDRDALLTLAAAHPFAAVIAVSEDGRPILTQTPALWDGEGAFLFHAALANPMTSALQAGSEALLLFTGPDAYVSPDWLGMPNQVPTWNYLSVEAGGVAEEQPRSALGSFLDRLSAALDPPPAWQRSKLDPVLDTKLQAAITLFALRPTRLQGTRKLSQNKSAPARQAVADALRASGSAEMANFMEAALRNG